VARFHETEYTVGAHDIIRRPGEQRKVERDFLLKERLGEGVAVVPAGTPIALDVRIESIHEGILASGTVRTVASAECVRCLKPLSLPVEVEFQELFAYSLADGFDYVLQDDHVDLEEPVRDAVVLSLPFQPVCADGCSEIETGDGITLVLADEEPPESFDPRWAALAGLAGSDDTDQKDV